MATLTINGERTEVEADDETPLLWALRDTLGLTGTKYGCGIGACGACTVHVNGRAVRACQTQVGSVTADVMTIEGLAAGADLHPLQQAFMDRHAPEAG